MSSRGAAGSSASRAGLHRGRQAGPERPAGARCVAFVGLPGAGKGVQARLLADRLGARYLATGDLLREEMARHTPLGLAAGRYMARGLLVPSRLVVRLLVDRLQSDRHQALVLDGFPRDLRQALSLDRLLRPGGLDIVVEIAVPVDVAMRRLHSRGRADDECETIRQRFDVYETTAPAMIEWYRGSGRLVTLDGDRLETDVHRDVVSAIERVMARSLPHQRSAPRTARSR